MAEIEIEHPGIGATAVIDEVALAGYEDVGWRRVTQTRKAAPARRRKTAVTKTQTAGKPAESE